MEFLKYPSIENHYQSKFLAMYLNNYPYLKDEIFIITEKLHGSNMQLCISKDEYRIGKRTSWVELGSNELNGVYTYVMTNFTKQIEEIQSLLRTNPTTNEGIPVTTFTIYGEYFGKGIQKGIDYGEGKQVRFFDYMVNDKLATQAGFLCFAANYNLPKVPELDIVKGLDTALAYDTHFKSMINPDATSENICEGIVIKPLKRNYYSPQGSLFYIKKKNEKFLEVVRQPESKSTGELTKIGMLQEAFLTYINKNRTDSVMSKYGVITDVKEAGKYINLVIADAMLDFAKDHDITMLDAKEKKAVLNVGQTIYKLIREYV